MTIEQIQEIIKQQKIEIEEQKEKYQQLTKQIEELKIQVAEQKLIQQELENNN